MNSTQEHTTLKPLRITAFRYAGFRPALLLTVCGALLVSATGCHKKANTIDPASLGPDSTVATAAAPTATLTAEPAAIDLGQTAVLNWRTTNATSVTIEGIGSVNVNGTQNVAPSNSMSYHLIAKGDGGTADANVRVTVRSTTIPVGGTTLDSERNRGAVTESAFHAAVKDVFFDYDSFELRPDAAANATEAAAYLKAHAGVKIVITGYCDERGSAEYNLALGENRANAAKSALINAGVAPGRIRSFSVGKEKQFCTEANEACWQENRRAQFALDQ